MGGDPLRGPIAVRLAGVQACPRDATGSQKVYAAAALRRSNPHVEAESDVPCHTLRGKVLGIRVDRAWRSFHVYADELGRLARERLGVADVVVFDPETRIGTPEAESGKVVEFARRVDAAVVGLGT